MIVANFVSKFQDALFRRSNILKLDEQLFKRHINGINIYSNSEQNLKGTFNRIFNDKIYDFSSEIDSPVILDCGANIGLATIFWKLKYPKSKIIAFEPSKSIFPFLVRNVNELEMKDVTCVNKAITDFKGIASFTTNERLSGSLIVEKNLDYNYTVETDLLSKYISSEIDLLKIDIEGCELEVLREIEYKLNLIKRIFIEYHGFIHKKPSLSNILKILEDANFRYFITSEYAISAPFCGVNPNLGQDFQANIWAIRVN